MKTIRSIAPLLVLLSGVLLVGLLAACGSETSGPSPTPTPHPASADEIEMVRHAIGTDAATIETSHSVVTFTTTSSWPGHASTSSFARFEADTEAPLTVYGKGTVDGKEVERLLDGLTLYGKDASGQWVKCSEPDSSSSFLALDYTTIVGYQFLQTNLTNADVNYGVDNPTVMDTGAEELLNGRSTKHFNWEIEVEPSSDQARRITYDAEKLRITDDVWVDPVIKRAYRLQECKHSETISGNAADTSSDSCWSVTISSVNEPIPSLPTVFQGAFK